MNRKIYFYLVFFQLLFFSTTVLANDWREKDFNPGKCFSYTIQGKSNCNGNIVVLWYSKGEGYLLEDKYSVLKGKTHTISGCYDASRANLAGPELFQWKVINNPVGNYGYIFIDKQLAKSWEWKP